LGALPNAPEVTVVPASFRPSPRHVYRAMGTVLSAAEVAHVQHSYAFFGGMHPLRNGWGALAGAVRSPLLLTLHELDDRITGAYRLPEPAERLYKRRFNKATFLHPAVRWWMVHAAALREQLIELGAPPGRITYLPLPAPPPPEQPVDPEPLRRKWGLVGRRPLVVLGFLARRKGYEVALAALRELPPEYVLVAAGGAHAADHTETEAWLRGEAERLGVADRFQITGFLAEAELEAAAMLAEVVLAPFHEMSASASLAYALARGRPIVATDLPEIRTMDGVRRVPPGDAKALAAAIRLVIESAELQQELAAGAARFVVTHGYPALAAATREIYEELRREAGGNSRAMG
jgi:glycosyltransferase involved in cell wall biosynthesis